MQWQLILEEFGPHIKHIAGVKNIVADTLSRLPYTPSNNYNPCTRKSQCCANELFAIYRLENNYYPPPLNLLILQIKHQKGLGNVNSNLGTYISDQVYG